jgi:hypothetical protein
VADARKSFLRVLRRDRYPRSQVCYGRGLAVFQAGAGYPAFKASNPAGGELIVTADLSASDEGRRVVVDRLSEIVGLLVLAGDATDMDSHVAAGPGECGRNHRRHLGERRRGGSAIWGKHRYNVRRLGRRLGSKRWRSKSDRSNRDYRSPLHFPPDECLNSVEQLWIDLVKALLLSDSEALRFLPGRPRGLWPILALSAAFRAFGPGGLNPAGPGRAVRFCEGLRMPAP